MKLITVTKPKPTRTTFEVHDGNNIYFVDRFYTNLGRLMDETVSDSTGPVLNDDICDAVTIFIDKVEDDLLRSLCLSRF